MRIERTLRAIRHPIVEYRVQKAKRMHRKKHPTCEACSTKTSIGTGHKCDVHHIIPVHVEPMLACDPDNLFTLCRQHHFVLGHRKNWKDHNPKIKTDALQVLTVVELLSGITDDIGGG